MGKKYNNGAKAYGDMFSATAKTEEGFIVPDVGTCVRVTKRIINAKVSPDKVFDCEVFDGIVVGVYPYQIAVHRIDSEGKPMQGENSVVYLRTQEIHMRNLRQYRKQVVQAMSEISSIQMFYDKEGVSTEDILEYLKLIPQRVFCGYEVGDYIVCEEESQSGRKAKRYILRIEDKRDNIMVGTEIRYGRPYMLRYVLALQLESKQIKIKKVSENVAFLPLTYEELALEAL